MTGIEFHTGLEGYLLLFAWVFAEQIGLPLPAVPTLLVAGELAATGRLKFALLISTALSACLLADSLWYCAGYFGRGAIKRLRLRHSGWLSVRTAERLIERYGSPSLIFAKFVPGMSLAAPPLSGAYGIKLSEFILFDALGSLIWSSAYTGMGYFSERTIKALCIPCPPINWLLICLAVAIAVSGAKFARPVWNKLSKARYERQSLSVDLLRPDSIGREA